MDFGTAADGAFATLTDYTLNIGSPVKLTGTAEDSPFAGSGLTHVIYNCSDAAALKNPAGLFGKSIGLKSVEVTRSVGTIGNGVFRGAPALKTIVLPENLNKIGAGAFSGITMEKISCQRVTPPTLPDDAFSDETFAGATLEVKAAALEAYKAANGWKKFANIVSESLPDPFTVDGVIYTVQSAADKTVVITGYDAATMPADLVLPSTVTNDGTEYTVASAIVKAFSGAPMKSVKFPPTLTLLPNSMLSDCPNLETIVIPASVTKIEGFFFHMSIKVKELIFEPGDTPVNLGGANDQTVFNNGCTLYLARPIDIPVDNYIGPDSPLYRRKISKVVLYPEAGECKNLLNKTECAEVEFTEGWTAVPAEILSGNTTLSRVSFPSTLTSIGTKAFYGCSGLKEVIFPESLESIGSSAFAGSTKLTSVSCKSLMPATISADVFTNATYSGATLYVVTGAKKYYNAAEGWKNFANVMVDETLGVGDILTDDAEAAVIVNDLHGRTVYSGQRDGMPALNPGIYVVRCGAKVGKILVK